MNEDDAKDAAWDSIIGVEGVGIWFDSLLDSEAAMVRGVFDFAWSSASQYTVKDMEKFVDRITSIDKAPDLECEDCLGVKPDVMERPCPYAEEIGLQTIMVTVCDDCRSDRSREIERNMM